MTDLPKLVCGTCVLCCQNTDVQLTDEEYRRYAYRLIDGVPYLAQRLNGNCYYLDPELQCIIYAHRPGSCRHFDCRVSPGSDPRLVRRGQELLEETDVQP